MAEFILQIEDLTEGAPAVLAALKAHLEESRRAFLTEDGASLVVLSPDGRYKVAALSSKVDAAELLACGPDRLIRIEKGRRVLENFYPVGGHLRMSLPLSGLPRIFAVARLPGYAIRGARFEPICPGWDVERAVLYTGPAPAPLSEPGPAKFPLWGRLFSGLRFYKPVYRANLAGYFLACLARVSMRDFPILMVDGVKSAGKSRTLRALYRLLTGQELSPGTWTNSDEEQQKQLGGLVGRPAPNLFFRDNIILGHNQTAVRSQLLSAGAHGCVSVRGVFKDVSAPVFMPIFALGMNGGRVMSDLRDKIVRVILAPHGPYLDPCPDEIVQAHRLALLDETRGIFGQAEVPPRDACRTRFYDFERAAVALARVLGLSATYDIRKLETTDAEMLQTHDLLVEKFGGRARFADMLMKVTRQKEIQLFLEQTGRSEVGQAEEWRKRAQDWIGQVWVIRDKAKEFVIHGEGAGSELEVKEVL